MLREEIDPKDDSIVFNAYCKDHIPTDSGRRLSSESVKAIVGKKHERTLKARSKNEDANWILNEVQLHSTPVASKKRQCK